MFPKSYFHLSLICCFQCDEMGHLGELVVYYLHYSLRNHSSLKPPEEEKNQLLTVILAILSALLPS